MHTHSVTANAPLAGLTVAQMVLCALAVVSLLYLPLPILPQVAAAYQIPQEAAGTSLQVFGLAYAFGFLVFGPLSDRVGRTRVLISGLVGLTAITLWLAWVSAPAGFIAGRALQGFCAASFPPVALAYLTERGEAMQRAKAVAWMSTAFLSAGLLGQIYGSEVGGRWGFPIALLPLAAIYAMTAFSLVRARPAARHQRQAMPLRSAYSPLFRLLTDPDLLRVYAPALLLLMSFVAYYIGLDAHASAAFEAHGYSRTLVRAVALPTFLTPLAAARMVGRWGGRRVAAAGLLMCVAGLLVTAGAGSERVNCLLAASVLFVAGVGTCVPALISRIGEVTTPDTRGLAVSLYTFALFVGASLGPSLGHFSRAWPMESLFQMLAAGLGLAAVYSATRTASRHPRS